jgi:hypothetical protein
MDELPDRWILPATGHIVSRWCVGDTVTIELSNGDHADAEIHIARPFELQTAGRFWQRFWRPGTSHLVLRIAPKTQSGLKVKWAAAYKDGTLEMAFDDGSRLRVPPGSHVRGLGIHGTPWGKGHCAARRRIGNLAHGRIGARVPGNLARRHFEIWTRPNGRPTPARCRWYR